MIPVLHSKILGKGTPLLIVHGLFGMGDNWITLARRFAEHFEVHLVDMRNHGRSFHDDCMDYETMSEDIIRYIEYHNLPKINIIGHSMGGKAIMWLSMLNPEYIEKMVVVDMAPKSYNQRHLNIFKALNQVDFKQYKTRAEVKSFLNTLVTDEKMLLFMMKNIYHKTKNELSFKFNLPVLYENYPLINEPLMARGQHHGKVLFLKGELSDYIANDDTALIKAHFPKARIVEVPKASHWVHADNPEFLYEQCISFFIRKNTY